ncbi:MULTISPECIES: CinA family protein [unclassified Microbacterium]|uniref:CinA family protein n=1 Tax=unclassified Microbacterium TaxID=2609290 RepID=UPI000EA9DB40|nr:MULTISPECIES: CinA family protein [unclassified Microbacterium]MBT2483431.1 CinA family protein [Microbacterium sp. ISL-108]RKN66459.1 CinA family protein [Microbacterium sp. CGR2]
MTADVARLSELAQSRGLRVAVAESLTSGRLANAVGAGESASEWFAGGVVAYFTDVKERVLGLTPGTDPCSAECAQQLATGARKLLDADIAVSTTGVGGPGPEGGHPPGTVYLGWATADGAGHRRLSLTGEPDEVMDASVEAALRLLAFHAEGLRPAGPRRGESSSPAS